MRYTCTAIICIVMYTWTTLIHTWYTCTAIIHIVRYICTAFIC